MVKGDGKYFFIVVVFILVKIYCDDYMNELYKEYFFYDWNSNKGYFIKKYCVVICEYGIMLYYWMIFNLLGIDF